MMFRHAGPLPHKNYRDMDKESNVFEAFEAMKKAYEKFMQEAEAFVAEQKERRMNLPPTLGQN